MISAVSVDIELLNCSALRDICYVALIAGNIINGVSSFDREGVCTTTLCNNGDGSLLIMTSLSLSLGRESWRCIWF